MPLVDLLNAVMGRTKMACHLHPILCTWDAVITCTPVTVFFPLGVRLCSKKKVFERNHACTVDSVLLAALEQFKYQALHVQIGCYLLHFNVVTIFFVTVRHD